MIFPHHHNYFQKVSNKITIWNHISSSELHNNKNKYIQPYIIPKDVNIYLHAKFSSCKQTNEGKLCCVSCTQSQASWLQHSHTKLVNMTFKIDPSLPFIERSRTKQNNLQANQSHTIYVENTRNCINFFGSLKNVRLVSIDIDVEHWTCWTQRTYHGINHVDKKWERGKSEFFSTLFSAVPLHCYLILLPCGVEMWKIKTNRKQNQNTQFPLNGFFFRKTESSITFKVFSFIYASFIADVSFTL